MSRILAVDYGKRRVGLAVSDATGTLATGLPTLERSSRQPLAEALARVVEEHGAGEVLLGLPLALDGTAGPMAREVQALARELRSLLGLRVTLRDERLTTVRAHRVLRESGVRAREAKHRADRLSAVLLLQGYLDSRHERGEAAGGAESRPDLGTA